MAAMPEPSYVDLDGQRVSYRIAGEGPVLVRVSNESEKGCQRGRRVNPRHPPSGWGR